MTTSNELINQHALESLIEELVGRVVQRKIVEAFRVLAGHQGTPVAIPHDATLSVRANLPIPSNGVVSFHDPEPASVPFTREQFEEAEAPRRAKKKSAQKPTKTKATKRGGYERALDKATGLHMNLQQLETRVDCVERVVKALKKLGAEVPTGGVQRSAGIESHGQYNKTMLVMMDEGLVDWAGEKGARTYTLLPEPAAAWIAKHKEILRVARLRKKGKNVPLPSDDAPMPESSAEVEEAPPPSPGDEEIVEIVGVRLSAKGVEDTLRVLEVVEAAPDGMPSSELSKLETSWGWIESRRKHVNKRATRHGLLAMEGSTKYATYTLTPKGREWMKAAQAS